MVGKSGTELLGSKHKGPLYGKLEARLGVSELSTQGIPRRKCESGCLKEGTHAASHFPEEELVVSFQ